MPIHGILVPNLLCFAKRKTGIIPEETTPVSRKNNFAYGR
jgi:hypothetical protein